MSDDAEAIIQCGTTKGEITLQLIRKWSPNGYDKAVKLFDHHFYDGTHFYRVVTKFLVQFGISYSNDKELQSFSRENIKDDPKYDPPIPFEPGIISYAGSGPNSRSSQLFISYGNAESLGTQLWETPIGKVISGMNHAEEFYSYGDMPPWGQGPIQGKIHGHPEYIEEGFPLTDKFLKCTVKRSGTSVVEKNEDAMNVHDNTKSTIDEEEKEENDDPFNTESPTENDEQNSKVGIANDKEMVQVLRKRRVRQVGNENDFFAVPQDKLGIMNSKDDTNVGNNSFVFTAVALLVLMAMLVLCITRSRRKVISKRN